MAKSKKAKALKKNKKAAKKQYKKSQKARLPIPKKEVVEVFDWDKQVQFLVNRAVARGFLTEAEVIHTLPEIETNLPSVEKLLDMLDQKGIELVDQEVASVWQQAVESAKVKTKKEEQ